MATAHIRVIAFYDVKEVLPEPVYKQALCSDWCLVLTDDNEWRVAYYDTGVRVWFQRGTGDSLDVKEWAALGKQQPDGSWGQDVADIYAKE